MHVHISDFYIFHFFFLSKITRDLEAINSARSASRGHEAYLRTGPQYDFDHYRQLVHEITQAFSGISKEVLEIKEKLHNDFDRPDLSEHIEKLQNKEKQKLELVGGHSGFIALL